jgi:hypothetical protein
MQTTRSISPTAKLAGTVDDQGCCTCSVKNTAASDETAAVDGTGSNFRPQNSKKSL